MQRKQIDSFLTDGNPPPYNAGIFGGLCTEEEASLLLIPTPWEATTSYGQGTAKGPLGILESSHYLDLEDLAFGRPYLAGIHMLDDVSSLKQFNEEACAFVEQLRQRVELSDSECKLLVQRINEISQNVNAWVEKKAKEALAKEKFVGVLGGDHSSPYGLIKALAEVKGPFGILHIDAHFDLREAFEDFTFSHASIMWNVMENCPQVNKLVQVGIRDFSAAEKRYAEEHEGRIEVFYDRDLFRAKAGGISFESLAKEIIEQLPEKVYISFDIDGLNPSFCPATGTPVPGGLDFQEALFILEELVASGKELIGFDLCEVAQPADNGDWDLNVGARILYKLCGALISSQKLV